MGAVKMLLVGSALACFSGPDDSKSGDELEPKDLIKQMKSVRVRMRAVSDLMPYVNNPNTHPEYQVKRLAESMLEFGWTIPVLADSDGTIIAGHGRVLAAMRLGLEQVPCIDADHMSAIQKSAYVTADNKLAEMSVWDKELLSSEVVNLKALDFNLDLLGIDQADLDKLLGRTDMAATGSKELGADGFDKFDHKCPKCGFEYDSQ